MADTKQDGSDGKSGAFSSPQDDVEADIGGVQGAEPSESQDEPDADISINDQPRDQPAPDAGEIEWAGQVVKKPPAPDA